MGKVNTKENKFIAEKIHFLDAAPYRERKEYIKELYEKGSVKFDKYTFQQDTYCWIIWKDTDIGEQPQFKGEPICKVVPTFTNFDKIGDVLNAQAWTYI